MTAQTDTAPAVDANHPEGESPGTEVAKPAKKTKYQELGVQDLRQPSWAKDPGKPYLGEKGRFGTGLDARLKSNLITQVIEGKTDGPAKSPDKAKELLQGLGWTSHLEASQAAATGKAQRAAKRAAEKEAAKANKADSGKQVNDRVEQAKKAKKDATEWVDKVVQVKQGRQTQPGQVLRVFRERDEDLDSPYVAEVQTRQDPKDADSPTELHRIPVADLKEAK